MYKLKPIFDDKEKWKQYFLMSVKSQNSIVRKPSNLRRESYNKGVSTTPQSQAIARARVYVEHNAKNGIKETFSTKKEQMVAKKGRKKLGQKRNKVVVKRAKP